MIITHVNPDLDACLCVTLAGARPEQVHFLPAGIEVLPEKCACGVALAGALVVDHPLGNKGKVDGGIRHAAASAMAQAALADPGLMAEVEEQDSTGKIAQPRFSLAKILSAIRTEAWVRGLGGEELDREVVTAMSRIMRGLNLLYAQRTEAEAVIEASQIVEICGFKIAILREGDVSPEVGILLNEEYGVSGAIYAQGHNLGVTRYPGHEAPDLRRLGEKLTGWFIHSSGFLACWGSRKSPATCPPPVGTPRNQQELLELLLEEWADV